MLFVKRMIRSLASEWIPRFVRGSEDIQKRFLALAPGKKRQDVAGECARIDRSLTAAAFAVDSRHGLAHSGEDRGAVPTRQRCRGEHTHFRGANACGQHEYPVTLEDNSSVYSKFQKEIIHKKRVQFAKISSVQ